MAESHARAGTEGAQTWGTAYLRAPPAPAVMDDADRLMDAERREAERVYRDAVRGLPDSYAELSEDVGYACERMAEGTGATPADFARTAAHLAQVGYTMENAGRAADRLAETFRALAPVLEANAKRRPAHPFSRFMA